MAPSATCPQIGLWVAKAHSCDTDFFPGEPPLSYSVEKRRDHRNCVGMSQKICDPASSQRYNSGEGGGGGGGFTEIFFESSVSQLIADQFGGVSLKAPLSYLCHKLGSAIF